MKCSHEEDPVLLPTKENLPVFSSSTGGTKIRDHLRDWQQRQENGGTQSAALRNYASATAESTWNLLSQSGEDGSLKQIHPEPLEEEYYRGEETVGLLSEKPYKHAHLRKGDVVGLRYVVL